MDAHLFEFVVPMVPPSWNEAARVEEHAKRLEASSSPTAVAVSTLDVCAPAVDDGTDHYAHWGLTHFLLDGHHKLQAAAESGRPLRLLSLLSIDASLATAEEGRARARAPLAHTGRPRTSSSHDLSRAVRRPIHNRSSTRRCAMPGDDAARELARLLRGPVLLARWPDGMTTDDVLGALSELGRLALVAPSEELERYRCSLVLHDGAGRCSGSGLSLTAAAVRCLLEAEEGIAALAADGIAELQRSLAHGEPDVTS